MRVNIIGIGAYMRTSEMHSYNGIRWFNRVNIILHIGNNYFIISGGFIYHHVLATFLQITIINY